MISGFSEMIRLATFSMGSFTVPSTTLQRCSSFEKERIPARIHQGARGEWTYFEQSEQRTILFILSVISSSFQIVLENPTDCDKINWIIILYIF